MAIFCLQLNFTRFIHGSNIGTRVHYTLNNYCCKASTYALPFALFEGQLDDRVREGVLVLLGSSLDLLHHDGLGAMNGQDITVPLRRFGCWNIIQEKIFKTKTSRGIQTKQDVSWFLSNYHNFIY